MKCDLKNFNLPPTFSQTGHFKRGGLVQIPANPSPPPGRWYGPDLGKQPLVQLQGGTGFVRAVKGAGANDSLGVFCIEKGGAREAKWAGGHFQGGITCSSKKSEGANNSGGGGGQ